MVISSARRSSSSARKATACSARDSPPSSESKSKRERRRSKARKRSRNCDTGGKRKAMWLSDTAGGSFAISRITSASCSGSCGASFRSGRGARGAGPRRKKRSRSSASRSASQPAASFIRRYSARRRASSSAASSGSSSASSAASSSNRPRAFSSSRAATSTRNSPQASRSSSSRSASRSMKRTTMPATSTSASSSSSFNTSVSSRSKGPSKASRSSSSSRTIIGLGTLTAGADAALRHGHGRAWGDDLLRARPVGRVLLADELPPDEEARGQDEDDDRDVRVQPEAEVLVRRIDPQQLLEEASEAVPRHVQREQRRPPDAEVAVDQQKHDNADDVPDELVQERRVEGRVLDVGAAVRLVDLQSPRQRRGLPEELLVEPVAPAADPLCEQQAGRDGVHEQPDAVAGPVDDPRPRENAEQDPAPDAEPALPDRERRPPGVDRLHLAPAGDVVVQPRADDPERHAPDRNAEDEIPVAAPLHPAVTGQRDAGRDREQQHDPVQVDRERADVDRAAVRRGNAVEQAHPAEDSADARQGLLPITGSSGPARARSRAKAARSPRGGPRRAASPAWPPRRRRSRPARAAQPARTRPARSRRELPCPPQSS